MAKEPQPKVSRRDRKAAAAAADPSKMNRRQQIAETYRMTKKVDPAVRWWMLGAFVVAGAIGFGLFWLLPGGGTVAVVTSSIGAVLFGLLATMIVFSRRAQRAAYARLEGQLGAGARALTVLKRGWKTDEVIGFTKQQDLVHRVVGPPGIVLVGEGNPHRLRQLMTSERRKHERVAYEVPIHDVVCGRGEGEVPLPRLVKHITKLDKQVKPAELTDVRLRIKAVDARRPSVPMPKGPVPTNMKGLRSNMRGR